MRPLLTDEQAENAVANVAEGMCPYGHGPLAADLGAGVGWCLPCSLMEGVEVGYRTAPGVSELAWTDTTSGGN